MNVFDSLREKHKKIIYDKYQVTNSDSILIKYTFIIPGLVTFEPTIEISKNCIKNNKINNNLLNDMIFKLGLIELISYYKCACPKEIEINCGYLDEYEQSWFKKLFYNGLGEFFYRNGINITEQALFDFTINGEKTTIEDVNYNGKGNLIPLGGGKDSLVTLELLKDYDNKCFIINPKKTHLDCINSEAYTIKRTIDRQLIDLNNQGFLNGHTPFSAVVAFSSFIVAYLSNRKYIVLSNEGSANEPTIIGTNINHQYSKTYEFEKDFYDYTKKHFKIDIKYFSLLRPIKEIQIAQLFSKMEKYHLSFRSCNVGSKKETWEWCCNCPKCLFIFIILRAFLSKEKMETIFGENLLDKKELENSFIELIGESETKPFECIGTIEEVHYAMNRIVENDSSYLSLLYKNRYYKKTDIDLTKFYYDNNVIDEYLQLLKEAINDAGKNN